MQALPDLVVGLMNWLGRTKRTGAAAGELVSLASKTRAPLVLVESGHEGWKQGWRGHPVPLPPGFHWKFKPHEVVYRIDKRETSMHLSGIQAYTSDSALFGIQDVQKWVKDLATGAITSAVSSRNYADLSSAHNKTDVFDVAELNDYAVQKGIRCLDLSVHRIQAVGNDEATAIKQRILAESEARLMAADSWIKANTKEINSIVEHIDTLAQAIAPHPGKVERKDRRAALMFLIEFRRTELLRELSFRGEGEREWAREVVKLNTQTVKWKDKSEEKESKVGDKT
ncbi:hypothetical protein AX16_010048 [Volvariella volvacea WC 439]|nr:hypothetical protein AX16_010048 [Volvariella volvacea WC 439]